MANDEVVGATLFAGSLVLEPQVARHADEMFAVLTAEGVHRHLDAEPPVSVEALAERYRFLEARRSPDGTQGWHNWIIRDGDGPACGVVQATTFEPASSWVAYIVAPSVQSRGVATLATRAMVDHLCENEGVTRFLATVEALNVASIRVLEKLDFCPASSAECAQHDLTPTERLFVATRASRGKHR